MKNKKAIIISIITIALLIGGSFAYWMLNLSQTTTNNIATSCFNISLSENNAINLQNAFPMRDSEGASLTPYEFTITNNCSTYAYYEVNLEVLNTTNLNSQYIKIMLDDENPSLLSNKTITTTTLSNASSSHRLKTAYLHASESKTYNLRLWLDENVTLSDNVTEKEFYGKITIRATYKPDVPTQMEECEAQYGEGSGACNIIAQADPANAKCLHTDSNGVITDYNATMSDNDTPIICSMQDDYGTSYYLRGLHKDNNVKFANMCWKIIRTTGTGGIKMIYNGDVDENGKCTTTSGEHTGFVGQSLFISGNKLYGSSYTKNGNTYTLTDTSTMNWANDQNSILGKYTCNSTSNTCTTLYVIVGYSSSSYAYALMIDQNTNYAQIGTGPFNIKDSSPSSVGYMFNDEYSTKNSNMVKNGPQLLSIKEENNSNYYYGDTISYSDGYYYITNQNNSNVSQLDWANNYQNNLVEKYTCKGTSKYNNKTLRCNTAYKVIDTTTKENYMISEYLNGGRLNIGNIKLATNYSLNNGNFELLNPVTLSPMDWYNNYSSYTNYYFCENYNQTTCNVIYLIKSVSQMSFTDVWEGPYYYGSSFTYDENAERPYSLTDTINLFKINTTSYNNHHYTCFYSVDNTCDELYFIYYIEGTRPYYIKLKGNETISDALDKMLWNVKVNQKDSSIKSTIDWWYEKNILGTVYENKLEDTIFCSKREINSIGGWSETNNTSSGLTFINNNHYLKCNNKVDAFTVDDIKYGNGSLTYPIGLLTIIEHNLAGNDNARKTGVDYWMLAPNRFRLTYAYVLQVLANGGLKDNGVYNYYLTDRIKGVRPSISLKPGTKFVEGTDGTASNPYEVVME